MADEIASLVLRVDSTQAKTANDELEKLGRSGAGAERAVKGIGDASAKAGGGVGNLAKEARAAAENLAGSGGLSPAARMALNSIRGLSGPLGLASAGAVAFAVGFVRGTQELDKFNQAILMSGNAAGVTAGQLGQMSREIGKVAGTTGTAAEALTKLVSSGQFAGDMIEGLGRSAVKLQEATGKSIDDTIREYQRLAEEPTRALEELNKKYNFLTVAVYEQVKALEEQGRTQEAARLALDTFATANETVAGRVVESASGMQRAWDAVTGAIKRAIDATWNAGRGVGPEERLEQARRNRESIGSSRFRTWLDNDRLRELDDEISSLEQEIKLGKEAARLEAERASAVAQAIQSEKDRAAYLKARSGTSLSAALKAEEAAFKRAVAGLKEDTQQYRDVLQVHNDKVAQIKKQFAGPAGGGGSVAAGVRELEQARQQEAVLRAQLESAVKITSSREALVKFEQRIADLRAKDSLTSTEKSVLANQNAIRQQLALNAGLEDQVRAQKEATQLKILEASAQETLLADQQRYSDLIEAFSSSPRMREQIEAQQRLYRDFQRDAKRAADLEQAREISPEQYQRRIQVLRQNLDDRLAEQGNYYAKVTELEADWRKGAEGGLNDYAELSANVASGTRDAFNSAFRGMEDALTQFVTTGKLSFGSLVQSILSDIARLSIRQGITGPLAGLLGSAITGMLGGVQGVGTASAIQQGGGDGIGALISLNGWGGPRAAGGPTAPGMFYEVNEKGPELYTTGGRTFLMSGSEGGFVTPLTSGDGGGAMPKITINNNGTPQDYAIESLTREEVILIADDRVAKSGPRMVAGELSRSNSRTSRAMQEGFKVERKR